MHHSTTLLAVSARLRNTDEQAQVTQSFFCLVGRCAAVGERCLRNLATSISGVGVLPHCSHDMRSIQYKTLQNYFWLMHIVYPPNLPVGLTCDPANS